MDDRSTGECVRESAARTRHNGQSLFYAVRTADDYTAVDVAHVIPWWVNDNDNPRNGLALCKLCHCSFDEGRRDVSPRDQVSAAKALTAYGNIADHLCSPSTRGRSSSPRNRPYGRIGRHCVGIEKRACAPGQPG